MNKITIEEIERIIEEEELDKIPTEVSLRAVEIMHERKRSQIK